MSKTFGMIFLLVFLLLPLQVSAEENEGLHVGNDGWVTFFSQEAKDNDMSSLSFSFILTPGEGINLTDAEFIFGGCSATIKESRYDKETGRLNVYIAGMGTVFPENGGAVGLGRIILKDENGDRGARAGVRIAAGSLKYVSGSELKWLKELEDPAVSKPVDEMVSAGADAPNPTPEVPEPTPTPTVPTPSPAVPTPTPTVPTPSPAVPTPTPVTPTTPPASGNDSSDEGPHETAQPTPTARPGVQPTRSPQAVPTTQPTKSPRPSETPKASPSVSPSPTPEASGSGDPEDGTQESGKEDIVIPATKDASDDEDTQTEEPGKPIDWVVIAAVIAIVLFVIVAAMAVIVLKKGPKSGGDE